MENQVKIIDARDVRYIGQLKEFKNGLPHGIVNKVLTDVGGTYAAVNNPVNTIIVVPTINLANSICNDPNNTYEVFKMIGGVTKTDFNKYIIRNQIIKIAVTYDSFKKITNWLSKVTELSSFKVLVDEYHLLLEELDYRDKAIKSLVESLSMYRHYTLLSATPTDVKLELDFMRDLPKYEIDWGDTTKIYPARVRTPKVYEAVVNLIQEFQKGLKLDTVDGELEKVEQLHIFINSVRGIEQICRTLDLNPDEVNIVCGDNIRNNKLLDKYEITRRTDISNRYNFYTKTGFQGCNVYSNNGLTVVVSDAKRAHTIIDIETTMNQIIGRIRHNERSQNIFRHKVYHIYSTNKRIQTEQEFEEMMRVKKVESKLLYDDLKNKDDEFKKIYLERLNVSTDLLTIVGNKYIGYDIEYNKDKEKLFRYKFELRKSYRDGLAVRDKYLKQDRLGVTKQKYANLDEIVLAKVRSVRLKDIYEDYLKSDDREQYLLEYPEFEDYEKYLEITEMNSARFNKKRLDKLVRDKKVLERLHYNIAKSVRGNFISSKDVKDAYDKEIKRNRLYLNAVGTMIENNPYLNVERSRRRVDGEVTRGYDVINKLIK